MIQEELIMPEQPELPIEHPANPPKRRGRKPKYETSTPLSGRPPRNPLKKVGTPFRFLTTIGMNRLLTEFQEKHNIKDAGEGRLMLYLFLIVTGQWKREYFEDGTFEEMRKELAGSPVLGNLVRTYQGKELVDKMYEYFTQSEE